ncbi:DUF4407 domain-containing protein [Nocardia macrotermitis]|uniref:DUF4407 domain-containing protein n=1 Tax=Nocardia macrotermitis TaxID=2585198 RepID=A0A7K0DAH2_9NOCA|nr:DUF4407 domain-containing protein [Nocardia macrotermitis]MQY22322.1 hypothetical protein [Nocardia macrotermitis]
MTTPHISDPTKHDPTDSAEAAPDNARGRTPTRGSSGVRAPQARVTGLLTWLGGAGPRIADDHERSGYAVTGAMVLLFAAISGTVVAVAAAAAHWAAVVVVLVAVLAVLLIGTVARALATAPLPGREGARIRFGGELIGRVAVAVLAGVVVAELASTVLLGGTIDRRLDRNVRADAESAASVVTARNALDQAKSDRDAVNRTITGAQSDIQQALIIARCEYNPTPQCPQDKITGVPGQGPETRTDNSMLADARTRLAAAQARVQPAQDLVARRQQTLDQARDAAFRTGDRGLGARWIALNGYSFGHAGAFLLRLVTLVITVALALLPLLSRWWRGETTFDRRVSARAVADRAEQDAESAIAVKRAEVRAESEKLRAEQELESARLAVHADTVIDREQQRRRVVASIGGVEIGVTAPQQRAVAEFEALAELPAGPTSKPQEDTMSQPSNLPAPLPRNEVAPKSGGLELPIIGAVPFTDTAARWIRPLVPGFVTDAIDTATHPLRTVRQAFEETEEITFTLRRTRKVTIDSTDSNPQLPTVVDAAPTPHPSTYGLPVADRLTPVSGTVDANRLDPRTSRQLPPGSR